MKSVPWPFALDYSKKSRPEDTNPEDQNNQKQIQHHEDPTLEIRTTKTDSTLWTSNPGDQNNQDRFNTVKIQPWRSEQPGQIQHCEDPTLEIKETRTDSTAYRLKLVVQINQDRINTMKIKPLGSEQPETDSTLSILNAEDQKHRNRFNSVKIIDNNNQGQIQHPLNEITWLGTCSGGFNHFNRGSSNFSCSTKQQQVLSLISKCKCSHGIGYSATSCNTYPALNHN